MPSATNYDRSATVDDGSCTLGSAPTQDGAAASVAPAARPLVSLPAMVFAGVVVLSAVALWMSSRKKEQAATMPAKLLEADAPVILVKA